VAVYNKPTSRPIVGDCLYDDIKKGNLFVDINELSMPYILYELIQYNCSELQDFNLLISRYNDLILNCTISVPSPTVIIPDSFELENGGQLLSETGDYILLQ